LKLEAFPFFEPQAASRKPQAASRKPQAGAALASIFLRLEACSLQLAAFSLGFRNLASSAFSKLPVNALC